MTTISPRFEAVSGDFDLATGKLKCVSSRKYAEVDLCFVSDGKWYVPFAKIKLHSSSLWNDAVATFDDAVALGEELCARWNGDRQNPQDDWHKKWQEATFDLVALRNRFDGFAKSIRDALGPRLREGQAPAAAIGQMRQDLDGYVLSEQRLRRDLAEAADRRDHYANDFVACDKERREALASARIAREAEQRHRHHADDLWKRMILDECWHCGAKLDGHRDPDGCCASCGASGELEGAFASMKEDLMEREKELRLWKSRAEAAEARVAQKDQVPMQWYHKEITPEALAVEEKRLRVIFEEAGIDIRGSDRVVRDLARYSLAKDIYLRHKGEPT